MMIPAMGTITELDRLCTMLYMLLFHPCGVIPTCVAISPVFSLTSVNMVVRLEVTIPVRRSRIHSSIASKMLSNVDCPPYIIRTVRPEEGSTGCR